MLNTDTSTDSTTSSEYTVYSYLNNTYTGSGDESAPIPIEIKVSNDIINTYTYILDVNTKNNPIYVSTSTPITEFTANIALQIYSWSNSTQGNSKKILGNTKRAAQDSITRAKDFVKQLINENYITVSDGLVNWTTYIKNKDYVIF